MKRSPWIVSLILYLFSFLKKGCSLKVFIESSPGSLGCSGIELCIELENMYEAYKNTNDRNVNKMTVLSMNTFHLWKVILA